MKVRQAKCEDLGHVIELYRAGLTELGEEYSDSLTANKVVTSFYLAPCFLLEIDDIIRGVAGLTVITTSHNGVASLADYIFYIEPEYRSLRTLNSLVKEAKAFASEKDLPLRLEFIVNDDEDVRKRLMSMNDLKIKSVVGVYNG